MSDWWEKAPNGPLKCPKCGGRVMADEPVHRYHSNLALGTDDDGKKTLMIEQEWPPELSDDGEGVRLLCRGCGWEGHPPRIEWF